jgi:putative hydrolase of the HAD superfamily
VREDLARCILFDLGNILVQYFNREEFPGILAQAILEVRAYLSNEGLLAASEEEMWTQVRLENYENKDYSVRPLEGRLSRIFRIESPVLTEELSMAMCRRFMKPIFATGKSYEDTNPALQGLREQGFKLAVVSNATWGSPASLWREELKRLGLDQMVDVAVFCRDVGWRKPAKQVFEYAVAKLESSVGDSVFVGDDPRWDIVGPRAVGMRAILIDRRQGGRDEEVERILDLRELLSLGL